MTRFCPNWNKKNQHQEQQLRPSWMDQYFAPIPSTPEIRFFQIRERYTNPPENKRSFYQIISDPIITGLS